MNGVNKMNKKYTYQIHILNFLHAGFALMSVVSATSASQILESFWNI